MKREATGLPIITPKQLVDAALERGDIRCLRYIVDHSRSPLVTCIATLPTQEEVEMSLRWSDVESEYKESQFNTQDDKIDLLRTRTTTRLIRLVCPNVLKPRQQ